MIFDKIIYFNPTPVDFTFLGSRRQLEGIQGSNGLGEQTAQRFSYLKINYFASTTLVSYSDESLQQLLEE